ncbi:MAG TPA: protein kinase [Thermoanaerobaculia bacterium]|nr:protein kinase [Thermoanaerobaculia bacterium]
MNALEGGSSVGRYRIVKFLGAGAMGEVYLAEDPQIDRRLAIKTVRLVGRPQEIEDRKKRLLREARAAGRLLHPHVVTLFDAGEAEGLLYLAFEFVEGVDLAGRLEEAKRPSLREVLRMGRQAAEALDYAHGQGIVHRDIKPSNILLDRAGRVKVADFGIAKMAGQSTELTMVGSVMGSPQYLSPEQIRGEDLDGRSDVFSLGVVLYEILSGKRPFDGETITTLVYQILHKEPPPIAELRAIPPRMEDLLRRMLAKDRNERIAAGEAARELAAMELDLTDETLSAPAGTALDATYVLPRTGATAPPPPPPALGTVPASTPTTPSVPPPPRAVLPAARVQPPPLVPPSSAEPPKRSPVSLLVAAVLLLLVAAGAGGWYMMSRPRQAAEAAAPEPTPEPGAEQTAQAAVPSQSPQSLQPAAPLATPPGPSVRPETPSKATPDDPVAATSRPPLPQDRPRDRVPAPVPAAPSAAAPAVPAPAVPREAPAREPEPEPEAPSAAADPQADQAIRTGLQVAFRVAPQDAFVLVEGRVIGTAQEWSGLKGARTYTFPGPGSYAVKIRKPGMQDYRIAVEAGATGGTTPIAARLRALPAADVESSDLRTVRVRQAIAFHAVPPLADVLVDGQAVGPARRYSGGRFIRGRGEWLELSPGKHRISLTAPGHRQQDILVEVSETAAQDREKIDVVLSPGGN